MVAEKVDFELHNLVRDEEVLRSIKVGDVVRIVQDGDGFGCVNSEGKLLGRPPVSPAVRIPVGVPGSVRSIKRSQQGQILQLLVRVSGASHASYVQQRESLTAAIYG
jgi:hypothetical protein